MADWIKDAACIDFETLEIRDRPRHPPPPVGVSIGLPGKKPHYYAFGHAAGGNAPGAWYAARRALGEVYDSGRPILTHNGLKFDLEVAEDHMGLPRLHWSRYQDSLPLLFLCDPRADTFALKPTAERLLGMKPDERDVVEEWLMDHQPIPGVKLSRSKESDNYVGAFIAYAPAGVVGPYANGDVERTRKIAARVYKDVMSRGMGEAYDRERRLSPHITQMERQGVRVDVERLAKDIALYGLALTKLEDWLRRKLRASESLNLDSGPQLANALVAAGYATEADLGVTPTGKMQTNKEALTNAIKDKQILAVLKYRAQLGTCLKTFMRPWCATAQASGGFIFTTWNSTRVDRGDSSVGTRTGRLSSTPNFQNLPKEFTALFAEWAKGEARATLPRMPFVLPPLPLVRSYVVAYDDDHVLIDRDFSQQEPRILGHFEGGALRDAYNNDPWVDFHTHAQTQLATMGVELDRSHTKTINLGLIYGLGLGKLAERINRSVEETKKIKATVLNIYPGLKAIYAEMKARAKANEPIRTWGGREYYCEQPVWIDGQLRHFDYKLTNVLIQGSASDHTKEAMIRYCEAKPDHHRLLLTVHDEILASVPRDERDAAMAQLKTSMESVEFDVPMLSEGSWSDKNWGALKKYDTKGKRI